MRNCAILRRRAPHSCLLHSNVGVLHQAAPALGEAQVTSTPHLPLMGRIIVRHAILHLRDQILLVRSKGSSGVWLQEKPKVKDDYEKFVEGMGDILGPAP